MATSAYSRSKKKASEHYIKPKVDTRSPVRTSIKGKSPRSPKRSPVRSPTTKEFKKNVLTHEKLMSGHKQYIPAVLNKPKVYDNEVDNANAVRTYVSNN